MSEAKLDWNKPLQTKGGERRWLVGTCQNPTTYPRVVENQDGIVDTYTKEGVYYESGIDDSDDLINMPEVAEVVTNDDLRERVSKIEERLAAIERAATCGIGPNEPAISSPAQADVGEASAVSNAQPPCHCVRCLTEHNDPCVVPFHTRMIVCACCGNKRCPHATDHRYKCTGSNEPGQEGSRFGPSEARIVAAKREGTKVEKRGGTPPYHGTHGPITGGVGEEPPRLDDAFPIPAPVSTAQPPFTVGQVVECVDAGPYHTIIRNGSQYKVARIYSSAGGWLIDTETSLGFCAERFRPIPAPVEQGPTTGMKAAINFLVDECDYGPNQSDKESLLRILVVNVGPELAAKDAEIVRLKADNVRLRDDYQVAVNNIGYRSQELKEARAEVERLKVYQREHEAAERDAVDLATMRDGTKLSRHGLVMLIVGERENVADLTAKLAEAEAQLSAATAANVERDEAAEAMEWMGYTRCKLLFGYNSSIEKGWFVNGIFNGVYSTPTAAILAVKKTGGE